MPWARASALDRHLECAAASWLPQLDRGVWRPGYLQTGVVDLPAPPTEPENTSAADWGTAMHDAKADRSTACDPWLSDVTPFRDTLWPSALGVHEQCVAYNCRTREVRIGPTNAPHDEANAWKEAQDDDCVTGECDWWGQVPAGDPWIDDLKTGWRTPEVVTPQTLLYLMLRCRVAKANLGYISITHWPKRSPHPTRDGLWRKVTYVALDGFEDDLIAAWKRTLRGPDERPGPWCQYCASMRVCSKAMG
jgi:hypothetical protein